MAGAAGRGGEEEVVLPPGVRSSRNSSQRVTCERVVSGDSSGEIDDEPEQLPAVSSLSSRKQPLTRESEG
jgi:hypothetical protein